MYPTIRDVASKAQVSFQLAAGVLAGRKYVYASEATRKRIFDAARELHYVPNANAGILRGNASKIIGVMIDSRAPDSMHGILAEIEQAADRLGYRILTAQAHDNPERLMSSYRSLKQTGVDGIISFAHDYSHLNCHLDEQLKDDPKIVFALNAPPEQCSSVDVDIAAAMQGVVDHLRSGGYRRTCLILNKPLGLDSPLTISCKKRFDGFVSACPTGEVLYLNARPDNIEDMERCCRELVRKNVIQRRFDSIITQNDIFASILMKLFLSDGIRIPQDLGIVGWDNLMFASCLPVTLTSVNCDKKEIAESILKILMDKIAGNQEPVRIDFPLKLVVRESTTRNSNLIIEKT